MNASLKDNAVLMRLSIGMPGEQRQDNPLTEAVKSEHTMGARSGRWIKALYPPEAFKPVKEIDGQSRKYHDSVTIPFDNGIGILPAALIMEYADKMREFASKRQYAVDAHFLSNPQQWIDWAVKEHNGTFDPDQYPGCTKTASGIVLDADAFRSAMKEKFYFRTEPLPVPDGAHFAHTVSSLLGTDVDAVNQRVAEAAKEAQKELLRRMIAPVKHMATVLSKEEPRIFDSLIGNIEDIARVAPALNMSGDPVIDAFVTDLKKLTTYHPDHLRGNKTIRSGAQEQAAAVLKKLSGYAL